MATMNCNPCRLHGIPESVTCPAIIFSGRVVGLPTVANVSITYTVNGKSYVTQTSATGAYALSAPPCSNVVIIPPNMAGYDVMPERFTMFNVNVNRSNLDFVYTQTPMLS